MHDAIHSICTGGGTSPKSGRIPKFLSEILAVMMLLMGFMSAICANVL